VNREVPVMKEIAQEPSVDTKVAEKVQEVPGVVSRVVWPPRREEMGESSQRKMAAFVDVDKKAEGGEVAVGSRLPAERVAVPQVVEEAVENEVVRSVAREDVGTVALPSPASAVAPVAVAVPVAVSSEGAEVATPAQQLPPVREDRIFEQVVLGLRGKLDAKNGKAEIRLDPPNLGPLHVSLRLANGTLTAEFRSSSDVVRELLKTNMEKLKSVLEGQGVAVDKLAVRSSASSESRTDSQNHDGRSAGNFGRDSQHGQRRQQDNNTNSLFAKMFQGNLRNIDVTA